MYDVVGRLGLLGQLLDRHPGDCLAYRFPDVATNTAAADKELGVVARGAPLSD
jgi:hypothetical protein